jgi:hypothetical protein
MCCLGGKECKVALFFALAFFNIVGPYAGASYNLILCRLQEMYHGQYYARVDLNTMPEPALSPSQ